MEVIMERTRAGWSIWGGCCLFIRGCKSNNDTKKSGNNELVLGGCRFILRHNNQLIFGVSNGKDDGEDARPGRSVWGGHVSLFGAAN